MSHENDSPNLTKKSGCLYTDFNCFISMEGLKRISLLFSGNLLAMILFFYEQTLTLRIMTNFLAKS